MNDSRLDHLLKDHARALPPPPCRITPELLLVKAALGDRERRSARTQRLEAWCLAGAGLLLLGGLAVAPSSLAAWGFLALAAAGTGAVAWSLAP